MTRKTTANRYVTWGTAALSFAFSPALGVTVGDPAPPFDVPEADGGNVSLAEHAGKVILLNFWASWCGPCLEEIPQIETDIHQVYGPDQFTAISMNEFDALSIIGLYKHGLLGLEMTYPFGDDDGTVFSAYGVSALPRNFIIDQDGIIRYDEEGFTKQEIIDLIEELLASVAVQSTTWGSMKARGER
ncbi:MAG: hypothetical protein CME06_16770 [Gemmatimonadetes bacterium]|nr:hypothetical protein [Gemmatimonadota bacterium]